MNKGIIITGVIILVLVGGWLFVASQQSQEAEDAKMAQEKAAMMEKDKAIDGGKDEEVMKKDDATTKENNREKMVADKNSTSRYVEYSKATLDKAASTRRVLFFYANWCPICKPADADFRTNSSKIPSDVTVIRVNYNDTDTDQEEKELAKKYAITYQHTFVQIDAQGKEVTKWNGGKTDELLANIK